MKSRLAFFGKFERWHGLHGLCLCVTLAAIGLQAQAPQPSGKTSAASEARNRFATSCANCHGLDGRGTERGPDIAARREVQRLSDAALHRIVSEGVAGTGMPPFRALGKARVESIVGYLRTLQGKGADQRLPGNPSDGKTLFYGKAECSRCHVMQGEGGFIGTDLTNYAATRSAEEVLRSVVAPAAPPSRANTVVVVTKRDGTKLSGVARNEDNFSLQLQTLDGGFFSLSKAECQVEHTSQPIMPLDYGSRLTAKELGHLVSYLMDVARPSSRSSPTKAPARHRKAPEESE